MFRRTGPCPLLAQRMLWTTFSESLRLLSSCMSPAEAPQHNTALAQVLDQEEHPLIHVVQNGQTENGQAENRLQRHAATLEQTAYGECLSELVSLTSDRLLGGVWAGLRSQVLAKSGSPASLAG